MYSSITKALEELKNGRFVLVSDEVSRENEADLLMAAEFVTSEHINFLINHARGLICAPLTKEIAKNLELPLMVAEHHGTKETAFTVSVDAKIGTHTGISSADRATTLKLLSKKSASPSDFVRPGHVFPLIAWDEGVLIRPGHTEAAVDLLKLASLNPVAVLCETLNEDGVALKGKELFDFSLRFNIPLIAITDLIKFRQEN